jgi:hypothetical protein
MPADREFRRMAPRARPRGRLRRTRFSVHLPALVSLRDLTGRATGATRRWRLRRRLSLRERLQEQARGFGHRVVQGGEKAAAHRRVDRAFHVLG